MTILYRHWRFFFYFSVVFPIFLPAGQFYTQLTLAGVVSLLGVSIQHGKIYGIVNERGESRFLKRQFCRQNRSRCRRHTEFCICSMLKLDRLELIFWYWLVVCLKGIDVMGDFIAYRSYVFYYFPVNSDLSGESRVDLSDQLSGIFVILFIIGRNH